MQTVPRPEPDQDPLDFIGFNPYEPERGTAGDAIEANPYNTDPTNFFPSGRKKPPDMVDLESQTRTALGTLTEAPPDIEQAKIDPVEALIATLVGAGIKTPAVQARAFNAPQELAQRRADTANQQTAQAFQARQSGARATLGVAPSLINGYYDRDSITTKLLQQTQRDKAATLAKEQALKWRTNTTMVMAAAKLMGEGKMTREGLALILQQQSSQQGITLDDEGALKAADVWLEGMNSSDHVRLKEEGLRLRGEDNKRKETEDAWQVWLNPNAVQDDKFKAGLKLIQAKYPGFENMTQAEVWDLAGKMGSVTRRNDAYSDYTRKRGQLTDAQIEIANIRKKYLPETLQADIDLKRSLMHDRDERLEATLDYLDIAQRREHRLAMNDYLTAISEAGAGRAETVDLLRTLEEEHHTLDERYKQIESGKLDLGPNADVKAELANIKIAMQDNAVNRRGLQMKVERIDAAVKAAKERQQQAEAANPPPQRRQRSSPRAGMPPREIGAGFEDGAPPVIFEEGDLNIEPERSAAGRAMDIAVPGLGRIWDHTKANTPPIDINAERKKAQAQIKKHPQMKGDIIKLFQQRTGVKW